MAPNYGDMSQSERITIFSNHIDAQGLSDRMHMMPFGNEDVYIYPLITNLSSRFNVARKWDDTAGQFNALTSVVNKRNVNINHILKSQPRSSKAFDQLSATSSITKSLPEKVLKGLINNQNGVPDHLRMHPSASKDNLFVTY